MLDTARILAYAVLRANAYACAGAMETLTIAEAARRLGVSADTIRRRIRRQELKAHQEATPQGYVWRVELPEGEGEAASPGLGQNEVQALRELVAALQAQGEAQERELEARRREVQELHVLLQQAQRALPMPKPETAASWWRRLWRRLGRSKDGPANP